MRAELLTRCKACLYVLGHVVKVVHVLDTHEIVGAKKSDLLQNMQTDLRIHYGLRFLVRQFAGQEKVGLMQLLDQFVECESIDTEVLDLCEHCELCNHVFEEVILFVGDLEVPDEL